MGRKKRGGEEGYCTKNEKHPPSTEKRKKPRETGLQLNQSRKKKTLKLSLARKSIYMNLKKRGKPRDPDSFFSGKISAILKPMFFFIKKKVIIRKDSGSPVQAAIQFPLGKC